jgi:TolB-like protein/Tfp pilus assembly protein PilF
MAMTYSLGPFRLDVDAMMLFRGAEPVALGHRAISVLYILVQRPGMPVSKDALMQGAWAGLAVEENNLAVQVAALRRVFGEVPGGESWIETLPRRGYRFVGEVGIAEPAVGVSTVPSAAGSFNLALPSQPSIAVLPFDNMTNDPEQDYFADGMVEEITTALSRFRSLFVIARNSSFTYKGRAVDVKQVGRELGVRYVLEGSVRKAGNRLRITGQLIDASTGAHLWADRVDGSLEDVFDLQDEVATRVVGAIAPRLERAEIERVKRKPTESLDSYDYYLRGMASYHRPPFANRESTAEALRLFRRAIDLDPEFAAAYAMAAYCYVMRKGSGNAADPVLESAEAARLAHRAIELGQDDAHAISTGGFALAFVCSELDSGAALIDRAIALNPNLAAVWFYSGYVKLWLGEPDMAIERFARAMRLSPVDPTMPRMQAATADAHFHAGRHDEAAAWAALALRHAPDHHNALRINAAANALTGQLDRAGSSIARLRQLDPILRVSNLQRSQGPYRRAEYTARYEEALRKAGLPE